MSAPVFTPPPWEPRSRQAFGDDEIAIEPAEPQANKGRVIALCYGSDREANARLIAAAPELYEALDLFVAEYVDLVESGDAGFWDAEKEAKVIKARAALAKARGEQ